MRRGQLPSSCFMRSAVTPTSRPSGSRPPRTGWWDGLIGPGAAIDTDRYFVVCPNVLGGCQGTTGPSSLRRRWPSRTVHVFPSSPSATRWQSKSPWPISSGSRSGQASSGGSMGGMRVLEWSVGQPERVARAVILAVGAAASADQIALCSLQVRAIRSDPAFQGGDYYGTPSVVPSTDSRLPRGLGQFGYRTGRRVRAAFRPAGLRVRRNHSRAGATQLSRTCSTRGRSWRSDSIRTPTSPSAKP